MITKIRTESTQSRKIDASSQQGIDSVNASINVGGAERWLSSITGGILAFYGLRRLDIPGAFLALLGADLLYRGISGRSMAYRALGISTARYEATRVPLPESTGIRVHRSLAVNRSADELYCYWHDVEKAPAYIKGIEKVQKTGKNTSHWIARSLAGKKIQWDSEFTEEQPGKFLAWKVQGKKFMVANAGRISFVPASDGRGTIVTLEYDYPGSRGFLRRNMSQAISYLADKEALESLRCFKELMEAGEIPTIKGQPQGHGRK